MKTNVELINEYLEKARNSERYFTVKEYFDYLEELFGDKALHDLESYRGVGFLSTDLCAKRNIPVGSKEHPEFKKINTYQEKILAEVIHGKNFREFFPDFSEEIFDRYPVPPRLNQK